MSRVELAEEGEGAIDGVNVSDIVLLDFLMSIFAWSKVGDDPSPSSLSQLHHSHLSFLTSSFRFCFCWSLL